MERPAAAADFTSQTITVGLRKNMEATLFTPNGPGPFPTILVMHTSGGISEADRGYCANLAREGYICIAPAFLRAHGITNPELRRKSFTSEARPIFDDFVEIIGELTALPKAGKGKALSEPWASRMAASSRCCWRPPGRSGQA